MHITSITMEIYYDDPMDLDDSDSDVELTDIEDGSPDDYEIQDAPWDVSITPSDEESDLRGTPLDLGSVPLSSWAEDEKSTLKVFNPSRLSYLRLDNLESLKREGVIREGYITPRLHPVSALMTDEKKAQRRVNPHYKQRKVKFAEQFNVDKVPCKSKNFRVANDFHTNKHRFNSAFKKQYALIDVPHLSNAYSPKLLIRHKETHEYFGICPYCSEYNFIPLADSSLSKDYSDHLLKRHGIFEDGSVVADPQVAIGIAQCAETKESESFEALVCPYECCSKKFMCDRSISEGTEEFLSYYQHVADVHPNGAPAQATKKTKKKHSFQRQLALRTRRLMREERARFIARLCE